MLRTLSPAVYMHENHRDYELEYTPNDQRLSDQDGPQNTNTKSAWDTTLGSTAVLLGLLDTGINQDHEDFDASLVGGYDSVNQDPRSRTPTTAATTARTRPAPRPPAPTTAPGSPA